MAEENMISVTDEFAGTVETKGDVNPSHLNNLNNPINNNLLPVTTQVNGIEKHGHGGNEIHENNQKLNELELPSSSLGTSRGEERDRRNNRSRRSHSHPFPILNTMGSQKRFNEAFPPFSSMVEGQKANSQRSRAGVLEVSMKHPFNNLNNPNSPNNPSNPVNNYTNQISEPAVNWQSNNPNNTNNPNNANNTVTNEQHDAVLTELSLVRAEIRTLTSINPTHPFFSRVLLSCFTDLYWIDCLKEILIHIYTYACACI